MLLFALALVAQPIVLDVEAGGCADGVALAAAVHDRAGAGSVVAAGDRVVVVDWIDGGAVVQLRVGDDVRGERRLTGDCAQLNSSLGLALALIVDPFLPPLPPPALSPPALPPPALPPPALPPPALPTTNAATTKSTTKKPAELTLRAEAGVGVGAGIGPGIGPSTLLRLQFGVAHLGIGLGGRLDLPTVLVVDGQHRLESVAGAAVVDGCYVDAFAHVDVGVCGVVEAGAFRSTGVGFTRVDPTVAQVMTAGAAVVVAVPVGAGVVVGSRFGLTTPLLRAQLLEAGGATVWDSPAVAFQWLVVVGAAR